jgi:hypothetical protein
MPLWYTARCRAFFWLIASAVSAPGVVAFASAPDSSQASGGLAAHVVHLSDPAEKVISSTLNLGTVSAGAEIRFSIVLSSHTSESELVESFTTSCSCTAVDFSPEVLEPGQTLTVFGRAKMPAADKLETSWSAVAHIKTDRRRIDVTIVASIERKPSYAMAPVRVVVKNSLLKREIKISAPEGCQISSISARLPGGLTIVANETFLTIGVDHPVLLEHLRRTESTFPWQEAFPVTVALERDGHEPRQVATSFPLELAYEGDLAFSPPKIILGSDDQVEETVTLSIRDLAASGAQYISADSPCFDVDLKSQDPASSQITFSLRRKKGALENNLPSSEKFGASRIFLRFSNGKAYGLPVYWFNHKNARLNK